MTEKRHINVDHLTSIPLSADVNKALLRAAAILMRMRGH